MARTLDEMREAATEQALICRARSGDRDAFDALVRGHFTHVYAFLHRMIQNHEDAEDLAQECFVRAWRSFPHYREESAFSTWILRIARHLAQDHYRGSNQRARVVRLEEIGGSPRHVDPAEAGGHHRGDPSGAHAAAGTSPADALARREIVREVAHALGRLPERLRAAIVLRTIEGREYGEVAEILGVKPATARTHVMQARRMLVRWLGMGIDQRRGEPRKGVNPDDELPRGPRSDLRSARRKALDRGRFHARRARARMRYLSRGVREGADTRCGAGAVPRASRRARRRRSRRRRHPGGDRRPTASRAASNRAAAPLDPCRPRLRRGSCARARATPISSSPRSYGRSTIRGRSRRITPAVFSSRARGPRGIGNRGGRGGRRRSDDRPHGI